MKESLCGLLIISSVMGSLLGLFCGKAVAEDPLVHGQEVDLADCSGWVVDNATWPAIERNAVYWLVHGIPVYPPGGHFRFRAEFPQSRYISWQNHDALGFSTALLADTDIVPDRGDNPFRPNTPYSSGSAYTVDLLDVPPEARPLPEPRPKNLLYGGYRYDGSATEYNSVVYRVFLPDPGKDSLGGVPEPTVHFVVDDPAKTSQEDIHEMCEKMREHQEAQKQFLTTSIQSVQSLTDGQGNPLSDTERQEFGRHVIDGPSAEGAFPSPSASDFEALARYRAVPPNPNGAGIYYNAQTGYLQVYLNSSRNEVTIMRFKAPTFPDTQGIQGVPQEISGNEQLRYWSLCAQDTTAALATTGCLYDAQVAPGSDGYVTVAFSDPENRPANAINWVPISGSIPGLILRHMQPNPSFAEALLYYDGDRSDPTAIAAHMGEYFPRVISCSKTEFEQGSCGSSP
jgi:hypothetical protein